LEGAITDEQAHDRPPRLRVLSGDRRGVQNPFARLRAHPRQVVIQQPLHGRRIQIVIAGQGASFWRVTRDTPAVCS